MAEVEETIAAGPGQTLAEGRKQKGLTQEEVAKKLHLSASVVDKLENNQFDDQIPDAFARGYLRNYAKLLGIEEQEIIASYTQLIGQSKLKNYYTPTTTVGNPSSSGVSANQIVVAFVIIVTLLVIAIWYFTHSVEEVDASPVSQPAVEEQSQLSTTTNNNVSEASSTISNAADSNSIDFSTLNGDNSIPSNTSVPESQPEAVVEPQVPTGFVESSEATLSFEFEDDCWVQVADSNGEVLAVGLKTAGRQFEVTGVAPISVVLGKPDVVNIAYNNSAVDLACFPANSTARFTLDSPLACEN